MFYLADFLLPDSGFARRLLRHQYPDPLNNVWGSTSVIHGNVPVLVLSFNLVSVLLITFVFQESSVPERSFFPSSPPGRKNSGQNLSVQVSSPKTFFVELGDRHIFVKKYYTARSWEATYNWVFFLSTGTGTGSSWQIIFTFLSLVPCLRIIWFSWIRILKKSWLRHGFWIRFGGTGSYWNFKNDTRK